MSYLLHHQLSKDTPVRCAVLTISDTRTPATDTGGQWLQETLLAAGHPVLHYAVVKDEPSQIRPMIEDWVQNTEVIITTGGTGISKRDNTFEAISGLLEKPMPGFGELFRMLSFQEVGAAAMLSRATAGVYRDTLIFCTPGSPNAIQVAVEKLILPELKHLVWELIRHQKT